MIEAIVNTTAILNSWQGPRLIVRAEEMQRKQRKQPMQRAHVASLSARVLSLLSEPRTVRQLAEQLTDENEECIRYALTHLRRDGKVKQAARLPGSGSPVAWIACEVAR